MNKPKNAQAHQERDILLSEMTTMIPGVVYQFYARKSGEMGFHYVSPKSEQIIGLKPDLDGYLERFIELIVPEQRDSFVESIARSVKETSEWNYEGMLQKPSGERIWFSGNSTPSPRADEIVFNGIVQDISERKQGESALRRSEEKYRLLVESVQEGIWVIDKDSFTTFANPHMAEMLGYSVDEMTGKHLFSFMNESGKEIAASKLGRRTRGIKEEHDFEFLRKDGSKVFVVLKAAPLTDESGEYIGAIAGVMDVTARKEAEEALRESEERFHELFEKAPLGYQSLDSDGRFLEVNHAWLETLGYSREEVIGKWFGDFLVPEHVQAYRERFPVFIKQGKIHSDFYMIHKDGSRRYIAFDGRIGHHADGSFKQTHCILKDETERKRIEEVLQKTQKLESLGILAGGIAHDFNNLMGGIFGYIDMANEQTNDAKATSYLSKAMNTIDRARALTQQLLTFAKGGAPIQQVGSLFPFVEETAKFALSGSNVICTFDVPQDLWACNFDKNQIGQVFDNLIINAQQAMPVGGTIDMAARNITLAENEHPTLEKGDYVSISVRDTGVGIPKELTTKIFDPFFTTKAKGHGLGLATSYSIIDRHGGCIDVESEPGKGSTFRVYLPATVEVGSYAAKELSKKHIGSGTFLVMDDEEVMRDTIGDMLETLGYTVVSKENGKDAIDFVTTEAKANRTIAGMIFDLTVPGGMGGKEAIEKIRKTNSDVRAFVASGYADDPVMKNPTEHGFMASICKPFRKSELCEMLNRYLKP